MSQVLKEHPGVLYPGGMNTAPEEDEEDGEDAAKADPLARLLQCHPEKRSIIWSSAG